jgi:hypothetical protein
VNGGSSILTIESFFFCSTVKSPGLSALKRSYLTRGEEIDHLMEAIILTIPAF